MQQLKDHQNNQNVKAIAPPPPLPPKAIADPTHLQKMATLTRN